jgi:hypothetical protein
MMVSMSDKKESKSKGDSLCAIELEYLFVQTRESVVPITEQGNACEMGKATLSSVLLGT